MMAATIVLIATVVLVGFPLLAAISFLGWKVHQLIPILRKISETDLSSLSILPEAIEKYQAGIIKIGEAQVESITKLESSVDRFADMMFGDRTGSGFQEYDEGKASRIFEEEDLVRRGIPREEARARVSEADIYSRMSLER